MPSKHNSKHQSAFAVIQALALYSKQLNNLKKSSTVTFPTYAMNIVCLRCS